MTTLVINNQVIKPTAGKATQIKIKPEDKIQFLDDNGKPLQNKHAVEAQGEDLIILNEEGQPEFVVSEYQSNSDVAALMLQPPATAGDVLLAGEVASGAGMSAATMATIGVAAVGGIALATSSGGSSNSSSPTLDGLVGKNNAINKPDGDKTQPNQDNGDSSENNDDSNTLSNDDVSVQLNFDSGSSSTDNITNDGKLIVGGVDGNKWVYSIDNGSTWTAGSDSLTPQIPAEALGADGQKTVLVSLSEDGTNPIDADSYPKIDFTLDTVTDTPTLTFSIKDNVVTGTITGEPGATISGTLTAHSIIDYPFSTDDFDGDKTIGKSGEITITKSVNDLIASLLKAATFDYEITATDIAGNEATGKAEGQTITQSKSMSLKMSDVLSSSDSLDDLLANISDSSNQTDTHSATRTIADNTYDVSYTNSDISTLLDDAIAANSNLI